MPYETSSPLRQASDNSWREAPSKRCGSGEGTNPDSSHGMNVLKDTGHSLACIVERSADGEMGLDGWASVHAARIEHAACCRLT